MGDTITVTGQVSIQEVNGLKLPDLHAKTFPNGFQPICIMVKPYIGAGVGRVDRVVGQIAHLWLVSPKQKDANGNIDWKRPEPIPTDVFLEVTGKLIGQGEDRLGSPPYGTSEVTLEISNIKNVDDEINNAVKAWRGDCLQWIEEQLSPDATATWKNPPRVGERPKVNAYHIEPFGSVNGAPQPKCAASVGFNADNGGYFGNWSLARPSVGCRQSWWHLIFSNGGAIWCTARQPDRSIAKSATLQSRSATVEGGCFGCRRK